MSEINIPKFKYRPPTQELLFQEIAEKNYKPIVEIISDGFRSKLEGDVYQVIQSYGINVDKDELIKALEYDRQQYEKGFADGCRHSISDSKAEVAREIFEELNGKVASKISPDILPIFKNDLDFDAGFRNGKTDAFLDVLALIAELKKKYTEEE